MIRRWHGWGFLHLALRPVARAWGLAATVAGLTVPATFGWLAGRTFAWVVAGLLGGVTLLFAIAGTRLERERVDRLRPHLVSEIVSAVIEDAGEWLSGHPDDQLYTLSALIRNDGPGGEFKAVLVSRSVRGVTDVDYPEGAVALFWQRWALLPERHEWTHLGRGEDRQLVVAKVAVQPRMLQFQLSGGGHGKTLTADGDRDSVEGLIDIVSGNDVPQRFRFELSLGNVHPPGVRLTLVASPSSVR